MSDEKPSKRQADSGSKKMPEGLRVVRKRRKKRDDTGSRQTLFLKKREILREMDDEIGIVGVKAQVERLKSARKAKEEDKPVEERWGSGSRSSSRRGARWFLLCVFALAVPVLAICTSFILMQGGKGKDLNRDDDELVFNVDPEDPVLPTGPLVWFNDNPHGAYDRALEILKALNDEEKARRSPQLFRKGDETLGEIAEKGMGWTSKFSTADPRDYSWTVGSTGDTGFLIFEGIREDQSKFRSYFLNTAQGLRMDWDASTGRSDVPFEELAKGQVDQPVLVRCRLLKEPHFDTALGDTNKRSWYLLRSPDANTHVWGYAEQDSALDKKLQGLFGYGLLVLERVSEVHATLRVVKPESGARQKEYRIMELLTNEWVLPEKTPEPLSEPEAESEGEPGKEPAPEDKGVSAEEPASNEKSAADEESATQAEPENKEEQPAEESLPPSAGQDSLPE